MAKNKQTKKRLQYGYMAHNEMVNRQVIIARKEEKQNTFIT